VTVQDREVLEALRDEPELLAIADAFAATGARRRRRTLPALAAAAAIAALVLLLVQPWGSGGPGLSDRALAAVGNGPIVHAVIRYQLPGQRVELATGRSRPIVRIAETWANQARGLVLVETRADGRVFDRRTIRLEADTFYPLGLAALYREALEDGKLQQVGTGTLRGHDVIWVSASRGPLSVEAALDKTTYDPLAVRYARDGRVSVQIDVLKMESLGRDAVRFGKPVSTDSSSSGGSAVVPVPAPPPSENVAAARRVLGTSPLWLGRSYRGIDLSTLSVESTETSSGGRTARGQVVHLEYGKGLFPPFAIDELSLRRERDLLQVEEDLVPPTGFVDLDGPSMTSGGGSSREHWRGTLQSDGLYITIEAGSRVDVLGVARALRPAASP
jgi:hypothetical protein